MIKFIALLLKWIFRRLAVLAVVAGLAWTGGLGWFLASIPQGAPPLDTPTDAVVVLTGGRDRLSEGMKILAAGQAKKLFVSGVHTAVTLKDIARLEGLPLQAVSCCVVLGYTADNTIENATETATWVAKEGFSSVRLVTADYHMRRSLLEFGQIFPTSVQIIPHPVHPSGISWANAWTDGPTRDVLWREYNKYLLALLRHKLLQTS